MHIDCCWTDEHLLREVRDAFVVLVGKFVSFNYRVLDKFGLNTYIDENELEQQNALLGMS